MYKVQLKVNEFCHSHNLDSPIEHRFLDLFSEMGELSKEILKMTNYGTKPLEFKPEFMEELGDVMYSLITIANYFEINIENCVEQTLIKYEKRMEKGSPGSENS